jgi:hypothetical protein
VFARSTLLTHRQPSSRLHLPPSSQVLSILQRGNTKKKVRYDDPSNHHGSEDDSSVTSSLALSLTENIKNSKRNDHFDDPFTHQTKRLLQRVPSLKKSIYWNQKYLEDLTSIKKNSVPFFDDDVSENDEPDAGNSQGTPTEPMPGSSIQQIEIPKIVNSNENKEILSSSSSNEFLQASWLKRYEKILSDDLLDEPNGSKSKSPTTRMPSIFPPLSSLQSKNSRSQSQPQLESFPPHSFQSSFIESSNRKQLPKDPLQSGKKLKSSSSQPLFLAKKKYPANKNNFSLTKL